MKTKLLLQRKYKGSLYTIGKLYIEGTYFCDTLEDVDMGLTSKMTLEQIKRVKIYGKTAIPRGIYKIDMNTVSPKFKDKPWAKCCDGKIPRLQNVKGFDGVLIHVGNTDKDTFGCILVGENKIKGRVAYSAETFERLIKILKAASSDGGEIELEII